MLISKLAEPSDLLPTLPTLPGEAAVDAPLVDQVVAALNQIYRAKGMETARAVGELLLGTFFEGDPAYFHERGKDHASFRQLAERDDLHFSHAFLWSACAVVEQLRQLPKDVAGVLPLSHHKLLLTVKDPAEKERLEVLSDREKDIVVCVTKGMNNKEIADYLFLSVHTVTTHRRNISNKLQIHTTAGLIIYAIANKLVNIEDIQQ